MSTSKPIIGIVCGTVESRISCNENYVRGIFAEGGIPVLLSNKLGAADAETLLNSGDFDGFLFSGGCDIDPKYFGETVLNESVSISERRDNFELPMCRMCLEAGVPIFGICRGVQVINVAAGGTLWQDIPGHRQEQPSEEAVMSQNIVAGTRLHDIFGLDTVNTNSHHHQAVKDVAPGFVVNAFSVEDGTIEGIENTDRDVKFAVGVQWHPENLRSWDASSQKLFQAFIRACIDFKNKK